LLPCPIANYAFDAMFILERQAIISKFLQAVCSGLARAERALVFRQSIP